jgi:hypothetical protein
MSLNTVVPGQCVIDAPAQPPLGYTHFFVLTPYRRIVVCPSVCVSATETEHLQAATPGPYRPVFTCNAQYNYSINDMAIWHYSKATK